ncbi:Uncharacterized protein HZ326_9280 [Fusarium oxysporum f. sp. albedinis]|nr:Uncharacterized protein HZ326_9280 [Fusarium oxysporum f. sp. albedinis]
MCGHLASPTAQPEYSSSILIGSPATYNSKATTNTQAKRRLSRLHHTRLLSYIALLVKPSPPVSRRIRLLPIVKGVF